MPGKAGGGGSSSEVGATTQQRRRQGILVPGYCVGSEMRLPNADAGLPDNRAFTPVAHGGL